MASRSIKLTIPEQLYIEGNEIVKEFGYSNIQDLSIESLRKSIIELKREKALLSLEKNFGKSKQKPRLTKEQKEKIAETSLQRAKEITKIYNLEDVKI